MEEFQKVIRELTELFTEMTTVATIKLNAARNKQLSALEECMTKEQASSLRLKGLDKSREEKQEQLGYGGMSFQQILECAPEDQREELLALFDGLSREIQMYQQVSEDAACIIEVNARQLQKQIDAQEGRIYTNNGAGPAKNHVTDRSV